MALEPLQQVIHSVQPYNSVDLMASVAALQLLPQNAAHALSLEALSNTFSTLLQTQNNPSISIPMLRRLCNGAALAYVRSQEDPSEHAFTEAFTFIGGSYIVFPGIVSDATFILRHFALTIIQSGERFPSSFLDISIRTLGAGLTLSDLVATRAELKRGVRPNSDDQKVYVPHSSELKRLKDAIQIQYEDLERVLSARGFDLHALEPLTVALGEPNLADCKFDTGPLSAKPLVKVSDSTVIPVPGLILCALRHRLISLAKEYGVLETFAELYRQAVWQTAITSLDFLRHELRDVPLPPVSDAIPMVDGIFSMDTDKALYVSLITDDFSEYDENEVFGIWEYPKLSERLEERQKTVEELLVYDASGINEIGVLQLTSGVGRTMMFGLGPPLPPLESPILSMSASDLETIAWLEGGDSLMMLKFATASNRLQENTKVFSFSKLDEFAIYRAREYSYYLSDDAKPTLFVVNSGSGLEPRLQVLKQFDLHAVPAYEPGYMIEVVRIEQKYDIPIYHPLELSITKSRFALVVEDLPIYIWIVGPNYEDEPNQRNISHVYLGVIDTIAYWLWQFSPALAPLLGSFQKKSSVLVLQLRANPSEDWLKRTDDANQVDSSIAEYELHGHANTILFHINPALLGTLEASNNQGERHLMSIVLNALNEAAVVLNEETPILLDIQKVLDKYAPLGRKKKLVVLDPQVNPALSPSDLPRHRSVKVADKSLLLDKVGTYLRDELGMKTGSIPNEERTKILMQVVSFLYKTLSHLVTTLSPRHLLDWLVRYHEAIRHDSSEFRIMLPTIMACYGANEQNTTTTGDQLRDLGEASQAARFVIEYIAARPPNGLRPMSWSVYDELQALASEIIRWAGISDLINYGIADINLSILPSGRLGSNYNALVAQANRNFLNLHSLEQIDHAEDLFDRYWHSPSLLPNRPPAEVDEIDSAFTAEFGYTLTELTTLMADCFYIGTEQEAHEKRISADHLTNQLVESTGYPLSKVVRILDNLSLESRSDFMKPPSPFKKEDVYPWRFGRPLSYIRRPLIRTVENGHLFFMWGNLHLYDARNYIIEICLSGRFQSKSTSKEMRSLLARFNHAKGAEFTHRVREVFDVHESLKVDSNVKKIGKKRLAEDGKDLGDIDILVVNARRRRVLVAECKDFSIARNPYEMANELQTLFVDVDEQATVDRHQRRARWIENNLSIVLEHYGEQRKGRWQVDVILVVSTEMLTPHIYNSPMSVISFRTLRHKFLAGWL